MYDVTLGKGMEMCDPRNRVTPRVSSKHSEKSCSERSYVRLMIDLRDREAGGGFRMGPGRILAGA